ncbi:MAG: hypothetical protein H7Z37_12825, partial [Pyrinomonadaceae bacterium]|nr:hypothetical protein [Pyrinomonadaceae bacterium]
MRQKLSLAVVVAACAMILLFSVNSFAQNNLRVEESSTRIFFAQNSARVSLIVANPAKETSAKIRVELLSQTDEIKGFSEIEAVLQNGANEIKLPFEISVNDENLILWRLRYRVTTANGSMNGTLAVSQIAPDVFEIQAVHSKFTKENQRYIVQTQALQTMSSRGVSGVQMNGTVTIERKNDDAPIIIKATNTTDAEGYAVLEFQLPPKLGDDDVNLKIVGTKNGFVREAENDIDVFDSNLSAYMQIDKPIYQPDQMLRVRTMLMKTKRIVADSDL